MANRADPDETLHFAVSHLGLRCLHMFIFHIHSACSTKFVLITLNFREATHLDPLHRLNCPKCLFACVAALCPSQQYSVMLLLVGFVALRPKSTAMVIAGRSVHLTTLFPGQA